MASPLTLTQGPVPRLLVKLAGPMVLSMVMQNFYSLADIYFVGRLGPAAVAAVSISFNAFFVLIGFSFIIGMGGLALIAQAFGRRDMAEAASVFKQSLLLAVLVGGAATAAGLIIARPYLAFFGGQGKTFVWGVQYFQVFSFSFLLLLILFVLGSLYRGMGDARTPMLVMAQSTLINVVLDPILIFGLLGLPRLEVRGAALASLAAQLYGLGCYAFLILRKKIKLDLSGPWKLYRGLLKRLLVIGLPPGLGHYLVALNILVTYRVVGAFGTQALASLGIGFRIMHAFFLPALAISGAVGAMVGQNFGAGHKARIVETFKTGLRYSLGVTLLGTALCWLLPESLMGLFTEDGRVLAYGVTYLTVISLGGVTVGTIMCVSSTFVGLGKTYPSLVGAAVDNALFVGLVFTLPGLFGWGLASVWWLKLATAVIEAVIICLWLRGELRGLDLGAPRAGRAYRD